MKPASLYVLFSPKFGTLSSSRYDRGRRSWVASFNNGPQYFRSKSEATRRANQLYNFNRDWSCNVVEVRN